MDAALIFVVSPLNARLNALFSKESSISFLLVEKAEKLAFSRTLIRSQGLQPGWLSSQWNACPVLKRN